MTGGINNTAEAQARARYFSKPDISVPQALSADYGDIFSPVSSKMKIKIIDWLVELVAALSYLNSEDETIRENLSASKSYYFRLSDRQLLQKAMLVELLAMNDLGRLKRKGITLQHIQAFREKVYRLQYGMQLKVY